MQNKKILSTLIIAILTFSMIAAFIPMASAIGIPTLTLNTGNVGDTIKVNGSAASLGGLVEVFWETTNMTNKLNETYATGAGNYECYVTIPGGVNGSHYIIVKDVVSTNSAIFTINPKITLTPTSGISGDSVNVSGTGFAGTSSTKAYFTNSTTTTESVGLSGLVGNGTAVIVSNITGSLSYKSVPLSVNITLTFKTNVTYTSPISLSARDNGTGGLSGNYSSVNATGTIQYDTGFFNITISSPTTEQLTWVYSPASATYLRSLTTAYPATTATTGSLGNFTASFTVPNVIYANYTVRAIDASLNSANATFTVTATITLTPEQGPTGTVVTITGRGFNTTAGTPINITVATVTAPVVAPINTTSAGNFTGQFIVPMMPIIGGKTVSATDGTYTANATFTVTGLPWIGLNITAGFPNWAVQIQGVNFTAIANTGVTVKFAALTVATLNTNTTGGFLGTFTVPSLPTAEYVINATDAKNLWATKNFAIAITLIVLNPTSGPTGTNVTITGYGFTASGTANVTIGTKLVLTNIPVATLNASTTFIVPTLAVGTYTVTAKDNATLTASTTFEVTKTTELILTPNSAPAGYTVTVEANYFTAVNNTLITFKIKNATWSYDFTANIMAATGFTAVKTNSTGSFKGTFTVNTTWAIGSYTINATDTTVLTVETSFSIVTMTIEIYTRASEYLQGDTISFYIKCTFNYNMTINITDPTGYPATISILGGDWLPMGDFKVVPYGKAIFTLPSDAKTGTWNWTATIATETETGTFTVVARLTLTTILDKLNELDAKLVSLDGTVATINSKVGEIKVSIDAIHLKVVAINGTVATIETDLGTMQGTVTSIDGKVATIQTDVGTVKADVSDIVEKGVTIDLTPVWIAVVFSLLAFIAGIAAVVMLLRKLA